MYIQHLQKLHFPEDVKQKFNPDFHESIVLSNKNIQTFKKL